VKHSNRYFILTGAKQFVEVEGHRVKNSFGFDLFWYKLEGKTNKTLSEGVTGYALDFNWSGGDADTLLSGNGVSGVSHLDMLSDAINKAIEEGKMSPRYTEPENNKPPKQKRNGMQRIKFYTLYNKSPFEVRERDGYLLEVNGVQYALEKETYGYKVSVVECGLYAGAIGKEIDLNWDGFAQAEALLEEIKRLEPELIENFKRACDAYEERIKRHMGGEDEKPIFKSVQQMKEYVNNLVEPLYYSIERPNGERIVRRFASFAGGRFNGFNVKGEEVLGLSMKGVVFTPNGFIIDGYIFDFRVPKAEKDEYKNAEREVMELREEAKRLELQEKAEQEAAEKAEREKDVEEWSALVKQGESITGSQFLELCAACGVEIPIKVKGWAKKSLVSISDGRYSYSGNKSTTIFNYYEKLRDIVCA